MTNEYVQAYDQMATLVPIDQLPAHLDAAKTAAAEGDWILALRCVSIAQQTLKIAGAQERERLYADDSVDPEVAEEYADNLAAAG